MISFKKLIDKTELISPRTKKKPEKKSSAIGFEKRMNPTRVISKAKTSAISATGRAVDFGSDVVSSVISKVQKQTAELTTLAKELAHNLPTKANELSTAAKSGISQSYIKIKDTCNYVSSVVTSPKAKAICERVLVIVNLAIKISSNIKSKNTVVCIVQRMRQGMTLCGQFCPPFGIFVGATLGIAFAIYETSREPNLVNDVRDIYLHAKEIIQLMKTDYGFDVSEEAIKTTPVPA